MGEFLITRRRLLVTAVGGAFGVAVLSSCSSDPSEPDTPAAKPPAAPASSGSSGSSGSDDWHRVNLSFVSAYVLVRGGEAAIVDTGISGSGPAIEAGLKAAGSGWSSVKHIFLTHLHDDHIGSLAEIEPQVGAAIYAGEADLGSINSAKPLKPVKDGDEVFGLRIIGTPGHTMGHVSIYDPATKVLVAGDALRNAGGLVGSDPAYTADPIDADASVRKLAGLDIATVLPGHGDPVTDAADQFRKLVASLPAR
jgi:glyoxylase-like metal-dependent hydrolase (beta-lactamase superfamily II)